MKVLVQMGHPGHVHFYKNYIQELRDDGNEVLLLSQEKDITLSLLEKYDLDYTVCASKSSNHFLHPNRIYQQCKYEYKTLKKARQFEPDLLTAMGGLTVSHVSQFVDAPSLIFTNNEHATVENILFKPFADRICTHDYFWKDFGEKHIRYPGYHELAYLHPDRYIPDQTVLEKAGLSRDDRFAVIRLVSWQAAHDSGHAGVNDIEEVVQRIEETGTKVLITSEEGLSGPLSDRVVDIPIEMMHDLLYFADLYVGESATMACESAVLGTPAVYISSIRLGYLDELESRYGLAFSFSGPNRQQNGLERAIRILESESMDTYANRRENLLIDKIDTTNFMLEQSHELVKSKSA